MKNNNKNQSFSLVKSASAVKKAVNSLSASIKKRVHLPLAQAEIVQKSVDSGAPLRIELYFSVFGNFDSEKDRIMPGAFDDILDRINKGLYPTPKFCFNHIIWRQNGAASIGKVISISTDAKGAKATVEFTKGYELADAVAASVQHGTLSEASFMAMADVQTMVKNAEGGRDIYKINEFVEFSLVESASNKQATITAIKSATTLKDIEKELRENGGYSKSEAKTLLSRIKSIMADGGYSEPETDDEEDDNQAESGADEVEDDIEETLDDEVETETSELLQQLLDKLSNK